RVYKSVTLEVSNIGRSQVNVLDQLARPGKLSLAFHDLYKHHFLNYSPGPRYAPLDEVGGMLIICYDSWLSNVAPLVEHKNLIGIPTTAVGVSTIPGGTSSTAIKDYIQTQYIGGNLAFVLLVGDAAQIATPSEAGAASDPSYSLLAGTDNYPDIMVGRFSAETSGQVDTQVQRTVEYETMPATQQAWFWKGMGIGSEYGPGDDGEYDWQHIANIRTRLLAHGYTLVDELYGTTGATAAQVSAALNAGRGIINYCGHGSDTSWGTTGFSNSDVAALSNDNMLPFIISVACLNGNFPGQTCFAEAWLRSKHFGEPIGAVGTYMSSTGQQWNPPMEAQDEIAQLYTAATAAYHCYGTLCYAGSCGMMDSYGSSTGSPGADTFLTWHVFGDPSLRVIGVVEPPTGLKVTPAAGYSPGGPVGGPYTPASKVYTLENKNATPIDYSVTAAQPWLTVANGSGTLPGLGTAAVTVSLNAAADGLAHGNYGDTINFINLTDHDGDTTRSVALQVGGAGWDPVATGTTVSASAYRPTDIDLNATDPNGDPLTFEIEVLPPASQGILIDPGTGQQITAAPYSLVNGGRVVRYMPPFGQTLSTTFTFAAWDATARSNLAVVVVNVGSGIATRVLYFPMDRDPGWSTEGAWAFGHPTGGGTHNHDPNNGYTGTNVYGYNLSGDYLDDLPATYLTTTALNCADVTNVELRFRRWLGVELHDRATIEVSNDGATWTTIWVNPTSQSDNYWLFMKYNIAALADNHATVYIRWGMGPTDGSTTYPGWNIDDVELWGVVNFSCSGTLRGDMNDDLVIDGKDVQRFVEVLINPYASGVTGQEFCGADMTADGFVTPADVAPFVDALLGL
ncbi:MAG TPA: C25 family cysteine peptidase, partial [Phycisphaerae bacterium]|nr:C25 family cysteine peptidase [Phycisphaerae bacterium]